MNWERGIKRLYFFLWAVWVVFLVGEAESTFRFRFRWSEEGFLFLLFALLIPAALYFGAIWIAKGFRSGSHERQ